MLLLAGVTATGSAQGPAALDPPVEKGPWIIPAPGRNAEPYWGVRGGIAVGLWPTGGPRGLLRIYTPYLGQPRLRMINFIAVEPIVQGRRGFSELERSKQDGTAGKAMWTSDERDPGQAPRDPREPAHGRIVRVGAAEALHFYVHVEPFANGARPVVEVTLRQDRPHEVGFRLFADPGGASMQACILTATMGNYARMRRLWLKDEVVEAAALWPTFQPDRLGFAPHRKFELARLPRRSEDVLVAAAPDEPDPEKANYAADVPKHWRYQGRFATQYWRAPVQASLVARVNGRTTYWATAAPIPGGVAIENLELEAPFRAGQEFTFGVVPGGPEGLGLKDPGPAPPGREHR
jgi:hypothetical protein